MKSFRMFVIGLCCISGMTAFLASCEGNGPDPDPQPTPLEGSSIMLPNQAGASVSIDLEMDAAWQVSNSNMWFSVYPLSGTAGPVTITVTAQQGNPDLVEKVASFSITSGDTQEMYYVVQDVTPGFNLQEVYYISGVEQEYQFVFQANTGDVEVSADVDWITVGEVTATDSTELDGGTVSKYKTYTASLSVPRNSGGIREGVITLNGADGTSATVPVAQVEPIDVDYASAFIRRSLVIRFTATWCGWCPCMNLALHDAAEEYPDHIVPMNMFSGSGSLDFEDMSDFETWYKIQGYPTGIMNSYADVGNSQTTSATQAAFVGVAKEAVAKLPANTNIGGYAKVSGDRLQVVANIASKTGGEYFVSAFILEDGIIAEQADYAGVIEDPENYEHNSVVRTLLTDTKGDPVTLTGECITPVVFELDIPAAVADKDNIHVVIYTSYLGTYDGEFDNGLVVYKDFEYVVDNVVDFPADGSVVEFSYEN